MAKAPGDIVDFAYLESYTAGDMTVITEVLALFRTQADAWSAALAAPTPEGWRDLAHTMKGAARGIGATALGDLADAAERGDPSMAPQLKAALDETLAEIEGYLSRMGGG